MATLLLSAAGSALGGALGGTVAGLGTAVLGKAVGATLGAAIDQRLLGTGSEPVETGRVERFRVMGSSEGTPIARVFGRVRVAGQLIWSSRFRETVNEEEVGGKGGGGATMREYSYSVSIAVALCEGPVLRIGRIWADGMVLDQAGVVVRLHRGGEAQLPDPLIAAIEGDDGGSGLSRHRLCRLREPRPDAVREPDPAVQLRGLQASGRGTGGRAALAVARRARRRAGAGHRGVCAGDGAGVLPARRRGEPVAQRAQRPRPAGHRGVARSAAGGAAGGRSRSRWWSAGSATTCAVAAARCGPAVEQRLEDGDPMPWRVSGQVRSDAKVVSRIEDRPVFGGTPCDRSVLQAIARLEVARPVGDVLSVHPDGHPGGQRPAGPVDGER